MSEQNKDTAQGKDPQKMTHPFELPDGTTVLIKHITARDYDELNRWVRQQYMANCSEATRYMNVVEKQEFMLAAMAHAATLDFLHGDGRSILYGSTYGMTRLCYQMIQNPPFSFEQFKAMLFPEDFVEEKGLWIVGDMLNLANTGKIDRTMKDAMDKIVGDVFAEPVGNTGKAIVELSEQAKQVTGSNSAL